MELVADRFMRRADGRLVDLATGDDVVMVSSIAGSISEQCPWNTRCDRLFRLRHPALARLVDFGLTGVIHRFEAWACSGPYEYSPATSATVRSRATTFLNACGLTAPDSANPPLYSVGGRAVAVPDAGCGHERESVTPPAQELSLDDHGLLIIERRVNHLVADLLTTATAEDDARPRTLALWGCPGAGLSTTVLSLARLARSHGFVPLSVGACVGGVFTRQELRAVREALRGRSLFLIATTDTTGWQGLLDWTLTSPKPHVVIFAGHQEVRHVEGVPLERLTPEALTAAVQPLPNSDAIRRKVDAAALKADGLPGRFVRLLWGRDQLSRTARRSSVPTRAAEQPTSYGSETLPAEPLPLPSEPGDDVLGAWPAPGELARLRRRMDTSIALLRTGRLEPGIRGVRRAIGGLARRHEWTSATRGALVLAGALVRRGRPAEAQSVIEQINEFLAQAEQDLSLSVEANRLAGIVWMDLGRLDQGETALRGAFSAARAFGDPLLLSEVSLSLARCLFWRGRYEEGEQILSRLDGVSWPELTLVAIHIERSRLGVGRSDYALAISSAGEACRLAKQLSQPDPMARAAYAAAFAHAAVSDEAAMRADLAACMGSARAARDPLCALKARLLELEHSWRNMNTTDRNIRLTRRIGRVPQGRLPASVRARSALVNDLVTAALAGSKDPAYVRTKDPAYVRTKDPAHALTHEQIVERHAAATGLRALTLFVPSLRELRTSPDRATDEVIDLLNCCQAADDGAVLLQTLAARLRKTLAAKSVAFVSRDGVIIVCDGARIDAAIAKRVFIANQPIAPHTVDGVLAAAAPVRYGGETIAALVSQWTLGGGHDVSRATTLLTLSASVASAAAAEVTIQLRRPASRPLGDIIGVSASMTDLRRSLERAAPAPFAVLIEGESGSGKELVARALHQQGPRRDRPFCALNCAALPDDLVESELFGHARGAFTGAMVERRGVFEEAHTGTLFLDEVGELSLRAQAKVLRTIQEGELRRVGENIARRVDVRLVSASNRNLREEVAAGRFRLDLLYRLDVIHITVPPLRERREDISVLIERFWEEATNRVGSRATLATATIAALARYDWPGNVRELQNVLAGLAVRGGRRGVVPPTALPPIISGTLPAETWKLVDARRSFEERFVRAALVRTGGHRTQAADQLGVSRQGLTKLMARLGITD